MGERERGAAMMLIRRLSSPAASTSYSSTSSSSSASFAGACAASKRRSAFLFLSSSTRGASASASADLDLDSDSAEIKFKPLVCVCETTWSTGLFRRRRRRRRSRVSPRAKAESKELKEIDDRDWESETAPGLFTRLVITVCLGLAAGSGGGLLIRLTASIFAIFLACVRYVFISVALIFILSLLWEEGAGMQRKEEKASVDK